MMGDVVLGSLLLLLALAEQGGCGRQGQELLRQRGGPAAQPGSACAGTVLSRVRSPHERTGREPG